MTDKASPTAQIPRLKHPRQNRRWLMVGVIGLVIGGSIWRLFFFNLWDTDDWKPPIWDGKPHLVETAYRRSELPRDAGIGQRLSAAYLDLKARYSRRNPAAWSMNATPTRLHGVSMLNQCMELSGTRYLVAHEAWGGMVQFGHSNLNGAQWVAAFELALQTNRPECYHPASNMWAENLLFIREKAGVVKVIPPSRLSDYQKAGLVDASYKPPTVAPTAAPAP